jgi:hypothetical protein
VSETFGHRAIDAEELVASVAWVSPAIGECHRGALALRDGVLSFASDDKAFTFSTSLSQLHVEFPWYLKNEGFRVRHADQRLVVLFGDPHMSGPGDAGRAAYRRWKELLGS